MRNYPYLVGVGGTARSTSFPNSANHPNPITPNPNAVKKFTAGVSNGMDVGDVTTLANPEIVESVKKMVQGDGSEAEFFG
jgi:hypothetical protein